MLMCFIAEQYSRYYFTMVRTSKTEKGLYLLACFKTTCVF